MQVAEACYSASQEKSNQAIVHDAFHLLLIQSLREREVVDELGFHSYFLTRDNTLTTAENMVYGEEKIFGSIHITLWFQMVSPFLSPKMCIDDVSNSYVRLLGSQFPSLTKSVNPDDLVDLMGVWMDDPSVDTEVLRKIVGSRYMKENLKKMHKIAKEDPNKISTAVGPLLETVVSNLEEKYRIKIAKIKEDNLKEITDLAEKIQSIQTSVQKSKALPKSLPIMGFLLLLSMLLSAILTTYWNMRIPEVVYWILGVGGIALIASYYFGEKVFGRFKW
jgi:DNA-directed RNA polymerase subunit F